MWYFINGRNGCENLFFFIDNVFNYRYRNIIVIGIWLNLGICEIGF